MELQARNHVTALTAVLTTVSLALVFAVVLRALPPWAMPPASEPLIAVIPHVNAVLSVVAIVTITTSWRAIRQGRIDRHKRGMLASLVLFVAFLGLYLYRVALEGPSTFPGPQTVYQFVYLPVLAIHMVLAVVCIPLLYYVLLVATTRPVAEIPLSKHPRFGRLAASLWLTSFVLGVVVYLLLYVVY